MEAQEGWSLGLEPWAQGHGEGGNGHDEHAEGHGGDGFFVSHPLGDEDDADDDDEGVDVGDPFRAGGFPDGADDVFGHGGVELLLYGPEPGDDECQYDETRACENFPQTMKELFECFLVFVGVGLGMIEKDGDEKGDGGDGGGEEIDVVEPDFLTDKGNARFAQESADVDRPVEEGESAGPVVFVGDLGDGSGDEGFNEGGTDGEDAEKETDGNFVMGDAEEGVSGGEQREGQDHGAPESDAVGDDAHERGQKVEGAGEDSGDDSGGDVRKADDV